ncbi:MAG: Hsp20/alpha crystallin family protein [Candidatus Nanohaloarchaea archaeon]
MRRLRRRDSFDDFFDQMEEFFNQFQDFGRDVAGSIATKTPVDLREENGEYVLTADLPGVQKDEINVKADEEMVEISAEVNQEIEEEGENYYQRERSSRGYRRKIAWPSPVDPETVTAEYENGVLEVSAEKTEDSGRDVEIE